MLVTQPSVLHRLFITPCTTQHAQQLTHSFPLTHHVHVSVCLQVRMMISLHTLRRDPGTQGCLCASGDDCTLQAGGC